MCPVMKMKLSSKKAKVKNFTNRQKQKLRMEFLTQQLSKLLVDKYKFEDRELLVESHFSKSNWYPLTFICEYIKTLLYNRKNSEEARETEKNSQPFLLKIKSRELLQVLQSFESVFLSFDGSYVKLFTNKKSISELVLYCKLPLSISMNNSHFVSYFKAEYNMDIVESFCLNKTLNLWLLEFGTPCQHLLSTPILCGGSNIDVFFKEYDANVLNIGSYEPSYSLQVNKEETNNSNKHRSKKDESYSCSKMMDVDVNVNTSVDVDVDVDVDVAAETTSSLEEKNFNNNSGETTALSLRDSLSKNSSSTRFNSESNSEPATAPIAIKKLLNKTRTHNCEVIKRVCKKHNVTKIERAKYFQIRFLIKKRKLRAKLRAKQVQRPRPRDTLPVLGLERQFKNNLVL